MTVAQQLYEGVELGDEGAVGLITYMRTDSVRIAQEAQADARREERHDDEDERPREPAAEEAPVHLATRHDVVALPAVLQQDDVKSHEQDERREREDDEVGQ